jgi:predicted metal-dependent enzyme (double-stranded beta helix superfamily)
MQSLFQEKLSGFCRNWSDAVASKNDSEDRLAFFRAELPGLLGQRELFCGILEGIVRGGSYPDIRQATLFDNEVLLYRDRGQRFSVWMYLYGPGEYTPVHDHTSWGVSGSALGELEVVRYRREDDGSDPGSARLVLSGRELLQPGQTEVTRAFDEGIHKTGTPSSASLIMISVYGRTLRRLYLRQFDPDTGRVQAIYPARVRKQKLAAQALKAIRGDTRQLSSSPEFR